MCYYFSHSWIGSQLSTHTVIRTSEHTKVFIPGLPKTVSPVFSSPGLLVEVREGWMGLAKEAYVSLPNPWFWLVVNLPFPCGHHWLWSALPPSSSPCLRLGLLHSWHSYILTGPHRRASAVRTSPHGSKSCIHVWNELIISCDRVVHLRVYRHIPHSSNI